MTKRIIEKAMAPTLQPSKKLNKSVNPRNNFAMKLVPPDIENKIIINTATSHFIPPLRKGVNSRMLAIKINKSIHETMKIISPDREIVPFTPRIISINICNGWGNSICLSTKLSVFDFISSESVSEDVESV